MAAFPRTTALAVVLMLLAGACEGASETSPPTSVDMTRTPAEPRTEVRLRGSRGSTRWRGTMTVSFANTGEDPLPLVWFRLWANGGDGCEPQAVRIEVTGGGREGALSRDCTALPVELDAPLVPGDRAEVEMRVSIDVPARNDRFGIHEGLANMGGALPVLAIRGDDGWHLDPYVDLGESFYSVVGSYRVTLDVPTAVATPATGIEIETMARGGRIARTYEAERVRDFAWSAGVLRQRSATVDGARVRVWSRPSMASGTAERALGDATTAIAAFGSAFGAYPYPEVDVVLASFVTFGGMEYPQFVLANPRRDIVAHELAHQWWWGLVGNDQFAEPWLDESLASWSQFLPWRPLAGDCPRWEWPSDGARLTNDMAYWRVHPREYGTIYDGGACMLADLAGRLGVDRFSRLLRDYAGTYAFGVAQTADFIAVVETVVAEELPGFDIAAFWDRWRVG